MFWMLQIIPNWTQERYKCYFCGEDRSVKYKIRDKNGNLLPACNKCAPMYNNRGKDITYEK